MSPRRRRLRRTAILLTVFVLGGIGIVVTALLGNRTQQYNPDEEAAEITNRLSRDIPANAPDLRFSDVTQHAGLGSFSTFAGPRTSQLPEDMGAGAAWGDYDKDGDVDLFLVSAGGSLSLQDRELMPSELYVNQGDGTFRKNPDFPETRIRGMAAAWGDYDNDGFLDLAVSGYGALLLFHNEDGPHGRVLVRDSRFEDRNGFWSGVVWGDFDNDRDLDLYVCGYVKYVVDDANNARASDQLGTFVPFSLNPASYEPEANLLFRNEGDGTFQEVAGEKGVANRTGRSLGALWHDFDDDGRLDLYVANDISDNVLFRNTGGSFEDISHAAWVADYRSAMGLAAGDWDRDGDDDLFITHWVAQENALYDNLHGDFNRRVEGLPTGHSPNASEASSNAKSKEYGLRFMDAADRRGLGQIALASVGWGSEFVDLDADGWLDLAVANGSTLETEDIPKRLKRQKSFLFWNHGGEHFYDLASRIEALSEPRVSRGLAVADYDNDGDMDILLVHLDSGAQLLRNDSKQGNWLELDLRNRVDGGAQHGFADGAKVTAHVGGARLRRTVSGASYLSQSSRILHFGLGSAAIVDRLEVRWLGGGTNIFADLAVNSRWIISENDPNPKLELVSTAAPPAIAPKGQTYQGNTISERERLVMFWNNQREAMNALKIEGDPRKAIALFTEALKLNSEHEDSRYYLSQCLAEVDEVSGALEQLAELVRINPRSRRAYQQLGVLRANHARSPDDLRAAETYLEKARAINPEETGALLLLGEVALMRGDSKKADQCLTQACASNPQAVGGFFLRAYISWNAGDGARAVELLRQAREALGEAWQPKGATSEGDVARKQHLEGGPLARFWERWDGAHETSAAFEELNQYLSPGVAMPKDR